MRIGLVDQSVDDTRFVCGRQKLLAESPLAVVTGLCWIGLGALQVANRTCGMGNAGCKLVSSSLWVLQPRHLALYMATHRRLGGDAKCLLFNLVLCLPCSCYALRVGTMFTRVAASCVRGLRQACGNAYQRISHGTQDDHVFKMIAELASADTGVGARALAQVLDEETMKEMKEEHVASASSLQHLQQEEGAAGPSGRHRRASPRGKAREEGEFASPRAGARRRRISSRSPGK
jgi:hypothetical protein